MDGGLDTPETDLEGDLLTDLGSAFFFPKPNKLRFLDFASTLVESVSISFSFGSVIVDVELPVVI